MKTVDELEKMEARGRMRAAALSLRILTHPGRQLTLRLRGELGVYWLKRALDEREASKGGVS